MERVHQRAVDVLVKLIIFSIFIAFLETPKDCFSQYLALSGHFVLWSGSWCHQCWVDELDQKGPSYRALQWLLLGTASHVVGHDLSRLRFGAWRGRA